ncbi:MAG: molybdopterin molybdotransferase MoeA [Sneathiella sp.]|nr:molybdopterin molybdotransferase MoeA [Sneathiella sp.]
MKRLADDCFANAAEMISAAEAFDKIAKAATRIVSTELCPLSDCAGRILAKDIFAPVNVPPADNSAVDGFAFSFSDYENNPGHPRGIAGTSAAGHPFSGKAKKDQVIKILTGAVMPAGFDTVAMIEDVTLEDGNILLPVNLKPGANCRKAGEDIREGQLLLSKGTKLRPQEVGYLASIGTVSVSVYRRTRVALFSTGDELVNPGGDRFPGSIYDSNRFILAPTLRAFGCEVTDLGILRDGLETIRNALETAAKSHDLVVTSGGVSMGDEDHVKTALGEIGHLHFWRIAIKPGRPLALGQIGNSAFVGLPGNPIAALVCSLKFVRPLVAKLGGLTDMEMLSFKAKAGFSLNKKPGRTEWLRGRYSSGPHAIGTVEKFHTDGSGVLSSLVWANGLIEIDDDVTHIEKGDLVTFLPFSELLK